LQRFRSLVAPSGTHTVEHSEAQRDTLFPFGLVAGINMWIGVTRANYTVREEFSIFLMDFAETTIVASLFIWLA
jgi:hypothetical protein